MNSKARTTVILGFFLSAGFALAEKPRQKIAVAIEKAVTVHSLEEAQGVTNLHRSVIVDLRKNQNHPTRAILEELAKKREIRSLKIQAMLTNFSMEKRGEGVLGKFKRLRHLAIEGFGSPESQHLWQAIASAKQIESLHVHVRRFG